MKYFRLSFVFTIVALVVSYLYGNMEAVWDCSVLAVLEVSFSFDNAVMNATVLEKMAGFWRTIFLTAGIAVAVFGMRFLFPIVVVWASSDLSFMGVIHEALNTPKDYAVHLVAAHNGIAIFGGTFLMCIFVNWVLGEKEDKWLVLPEAFFEKVGANHRGESYWPLAVWLTCSLWSYPSLDLQMVCALAIVVYIFVKWLSDKLSDNKDTVKAGLGLFLYLELLDASFSFDGVMGAFAVTQNIIIIALGLGIGAMFVRSMTIMLVETGSLKTYPYLGNGANWAIGTLAFLVLLGIQIYVPEWITGLSGAGFVISAALTKKKEA